MTTTTTTPEVPFLDVTAPGFSITSAEVHEAREQSWYARTPYGIAVLRYDEMNRLVKHPKLRQGSVAWPAHNGITVAPSPAGGPAGCSTRRATSTTGSVG